MSACRKSLSSLPRSGQLTSSKSTSHCSHRLHKCQTFLNVRRRAVCRWRGCDEGWTDQWHWSRTLMSSGSTQDKGIRHDQRVAPLPFNCSLTTHKTPDPPLTLSPVCCPLLAACGSPPPHRSTSASDRDKLRDVSLMQHVTLVIKTNTTWRWHEGQIPRSECVCRTQWKAKYWSEFTPKTSILGADLRSPPTPPTVNFWLNANKSAFEIQVLLLTHNWCKYKNLIEIEKIRGFIIFKTN